MDNNDEMLEIIKNYIDKKMHIASGKDYHYRAANILDYEKMHNKCDKGIYFICDDDNKVLYIGQAGFRTISEQNTSLSKRVENYRWGIIKDWLPNEFEADINLTWQKSKYYNNVIRKGWKVKVLFLPNISNEDDARLIEDFCFYIFMPKFNSEEKRNKGVSEIISVCKVLSEA